MGRAGGSRPLRRASILALRLARLTPSREQLSSSACAAKWVSVAPEASERQARTGSGLCVLALMQARLLQRFHSARRGPPLAALGSWPQGEQPCFSEHR